jgi:hypothetical protein
VMPTISMYHFLPSVTSSWILPTETNLSDLTDETDETGEEVL